MSFTTNDCFCLSVYFVFVLYDVFYIVTHMFLQDDKWKKHKKIFWLTENYILKGHVPELHRKTFYLELTSLFMLSQIKLDF